MKTTIAHTGCAYHFGKTNFSNIPTVKTKNYFAKA